MREHHAYVHGWGIGRYQARCHDCDWVGPEGDSVEGAHDEAHMHGVMTLRRALRSSTSPPHSTDTDSNAVKQVKEPS